jgi:hypothetical protein
MDAFRITLGHRQDTASAAFSVCATRSPGRAPVVASHCTSFDDNGRALHCCLGGCFMLFGRTLSSTGQKLSYLFTAGSEFSLDCPPCAQESPPRNAPTAGHSCDQIHWGIILFLQFAATLGIFVRGRYRTVPSAASLGMRSEARITRGNRTQRPEPRYAFVKCFYTAGLLKI